MNNIQEYFYVYDKDQTENFVYKGYNQIRNLLSPEERAALAKSLFENKDKDYISL